MSHQIVLNNIDYARQLSRTNQSVKQVVLVCGGADDQAYLQNLLDQHSHCLFNADGSTGISVFEERVGLKTRQGNFLGALLAYQKLKRQDCEFQKDGEDTVILMGMVFGRGERISPFSQVTGNRKALISVMSPRLEQWNVQALTSIEEAMCFFSPLAVALQQGGFQGILCKWGDETQIPSIPLEKLAKSQAFAQSDVIKCVAQISMTDESASQKDWVIFDAVSRRMITQCSRNEKSVLEDVIKSWKAKYPQAQAGISLGPVAVSSKVLDLACEIFASDIECDGVFLDFDPFVIQALGFDGDEAVWNAEVAKDAGLQKIIQMVPDFWTKIKSLKQRFAEAYGRPLKVDTLDLGEDLYWADIGQHTAFAEKVFAVNEKSERGEIARKIEDIVDIPGLRDARGNLIVDSFIAPGVEVFDSIIIHSVITGTGSVAGSVIKNSLLHDVRMKQSFALHSARVSVAMEEGGGLYEAVGLRPVALAAHERLGTLLADGDLVDLKASAAIDLKDKKLNYDCAIFDNKLSFAQAFDIMRPLSISKLENLRRSAVAEVVELIVENLLVMLQDGLITEKDFNDALAIIAVKKLEK